MQNLVTLSKLPRNIVNINNLFIKDTLLLPLIFLTLILLLLKDLQEIVFKLSILFKLTILFFFSFKYSDRYSLNNFLKVMLTQYETNIKFFFLKSVLYINNYYSTKKTYKGITCI